MGKKRKVTTEKKTVDNRNGAVVNPAEQSDAAVAVEVAAKSIPKLGRDIQKKYGAALFMLASQYEDPERLPTGLEDLDAILRGGWPKGRISEAWGPQSSGKSTIVLVTIAAVQRMKPGFNKDGSPKVRIAYFDQENTFSPSWAKKHGVDLDRLYLVKALPAEEAGELMLKMIRAKWDLLIVDSIVELLSEKELEKKLSEDSVAALARVLAKLLPKVIHLQSVSPTVLLLVNQVRDDIGSRASFYIGGGSKAPGGQTLYHLDSLRLRIQRKEFIKDKDGLKIGAVVAIKVVKSKVSKEQEECRVFILFDRGIVSAKEAGYEG